MVENPKTFYISKMNSARQGLNNLMDHMVNKYTKNKNPGVVTIYNYMMTPSNGNIFRVTGPLCGEFTGYGEFPSQIPVTWSFDVFFYLC